MNKPELKRLIWRCYLEQQFAMLTALLPVAYLLTLVMGLEDQLALRVILTNVTFNTPVWGFVVTYVMIRTLVTNAVEERRTDQPGDRLRRILKAPRKMEIWIMVAYQGACVVWATWPTLVYDLNPWIIPQSVLAFGLLAQVVGIRMSVRMERVLRPVAIEEMHKYPQLVIDDERGFLWPKQRWFLPYSFAIIVFATIVTTAMIVVKKTSSGFTALFAELDRVAPAALSLVQVRVDAIFNSIVWPIVGIGGFMTLVAAWCAWEIARHQNEGSTAVQRSIGSIASGKPALPEWVSTDEVGDLSMATSSAFERLRTFASSLGDSAQTLGATAGRLNSSRKEQTEALSAQAAALQETQVTAQEIRQTSMVAAQKAEDVLQHAERADKIGRAGETALEESLEGMKTIQQQVVQMAQSIRSLDERAQQVANITATVKSLADRSNMLALNAAIEAVRSGEHGKGFSVVAREIRSLADQSIKATHNVQTILQDLSESIRSTAQMSEGGLTQVQGSVQQLRSFGESIRQMSGIVRDNVSSVRQISAAVNQQNQGIGQIFQAVNDLTRIMDQTLESVRTGEEAADHMRVVASRVTSFVEEYDFKQDAPASS